MSLPKIYADFQNVDDYGRLKLTCLGTRQDLQRQGIVLHEGLTLTLYTADADDRGQSDELRAEGVVHYSKDEQCWVAPLNWAELRQASGEGGMGVLGGGAPPGGNPPLGRPLPNTGG